MVLSGTVTVSGLIVADPASEPTFPNSSHTERIQLGVNNSNTHITFRKPQIALKVLPSTLEICQYYGRIPPSMINLPESYDPYSK